MADTPEIESALESVVSDESSLNSIVQAAVQEEPSTPNEAQTPARATPTSAPQKGGRKTPRYRRTKQYHLYSPVQKADIAKHAAQHGNRSAATYFTRELGIVVPESTIRTFKKAYYAKLSEGKQPEEITEIPLRRRGRPRKSEGDDKSTPAKEKKSRIEVTQVAETTGFLEMTSDISMSAISDLINTDGAEKPLVVIFGATDGAVESKELIDVAMVKSFPGDTDPAVLSDDQCSKVMALIVGVQCQIDLAFLSRCPKLRIVIVFGMGADGVDLEFAGRLGIVVCNVPDYAIEEVADTAITHILTLFRQTFFFHAKVLKGVQYHTFKDIMSDAKCRRLRGKTLGLVGMGKTGFAVAQRAKAFGFNIAFYDPCIGSGWDKAFGGLERCKSLSDLVMKSDCVSLHCMLTEESRHLVNESLLRVFKRGAYIVNVSRGALIDEKALAKALREGWIGGAALDVHEVEPFNIQQSPLKDAPNLICTPHVAWYSKEGFAELRTSGIRLVRRVLTGSDPTGIQNCVNEQHLDGDACNARWNTTA